MSEIAVAVNYKNSVDFIQMYKKLTFNDRVDSTNRQKRSHLKRYKNLTNQCDVMA